MDILCVSSRDWRTFFYQIVHISACISCTEVIEHSLDASSPTEDVCFARIVIDRATRANFVCSKKLGIFSFQNSRGDQGTNTNILHVDVLLQKCLNDLSTSILWNLRPRSDRRHCSRPIWSNVEVFFLCSVVVTPLEVQSFCYYRRRHSLARLLLRRFPKISPSPIERG